MGIVLSLFYSPPTPPGRIGNEGLFLTFFFFLNKSVKSASVSFSCRYACFSTWLLSTCKNKAWLPYLAMHCVHHSWQQDHWKYPSPAMPLREGPEHLLNIPISHHSRLVGNTWARFYHPPTDAFGGSYQCPEEPLGWVYVSGFSRRFLGLEQEVTALHKGERRASQAKAVWQGQARTQKCS